MRCGASHQVWFLCVVWALQLMSLMQTMCRDDSAIMAETHVRSKLQTYSMVPADVQ